MNGIQIFPSVAAALQAGFQFLSAYPDADGFLHARIRTAAGWAVALVNVAEGAWLK